MSIVFPLSTNRIILKKVDIYDKIIEILLENRWTLIYSEEKDGSKVIKSPKGSYIRFYPYSYYESYSAGHDIRIANVGYSYIGLEPLYGFEDGVSIRSEKKYSAQIVNGGSNQNICQLTWYVDDIGFIFIGKGDPPNDESCFISYGLSRDSINPDKDPRVDSILWSDHLCNMSSNSNIGNYCAVLDYPNSAPGLQKNISSLMYINYPIIFNGVDGLGKVIITDMRYGDQYVGLLGYINGIYAIPAMSKSNSNLRDGDRIEKDGKIYEILRIRDQNLVGTVNFAIEINE